MGLSGCYSLIKWLVILVNFIFWLVGLAVLVLSIWMLTDPTFYLSVAQDESSYNTGVYILLAAGLLMFVVGFVGCCGAYKESPCMLVTFFCFLLIIVVAEIAAGAWGYSHRDALEDYVTESVKTTVQNEYDVVKSRTQTFDAIQQGLQCCGAKGPDDWESSRYNMANRDAIERMVSSALNKYRIPESCCVDPQSALCQSAALGGGQGVPPGVIHGKGCISKLIDTLRQHMNVVLGVGLAIVVIEVLGLVFSLALCCAVHGAENRYKA
ncbi:CD9 antigen isoform X2 [Bacillus rossius redtenbacheri]|uniref:CD9 antigen isoform X2 n=1 Tax=Bacillus rossius redtenbacheri TaxID=93214 RepID=UPI002FDD1648